MPNRARGTPSCRARPTSGFAAVTRSKEQRVVEALRCDGIYLLWDWAVLQSGRLSPLPQLGVIWRDDVEGCRALEAVIRVGLYEPRASGGRPLWGRDGTGRARAASNFHPHCAPLVQGSKPREGEREREPTKKAGGFRGGLIGGDSTTQNAITPQLTVSASLSALGQFLLHRLQAAQDEWTTWCA